MSSVEQDDSRSELNSGQEYFGELVVACRDGSKMLEFIEEALDEVAFAVEREIAALGILRFAFGGITGVIPRWARVSINESAS